MASFKNVLISTIRRSYGKKDRTYFETIVATWLINGWLTEEEGIEVMAVLEEVYGPSEEEANK